MRKICGQTQQTTKKEPQRSHCVPDSQPVCKGAQKYAYSKDIIYKAEKQVRIIERKSADQGQPIELADHRPPDFAATKNIKRRRERKKDLSGDNEREYPKQGCHDKIDRQIRQWTKIEKIPLLPEGIVMIMSEDVAPYKMIGIVHHARIFHNPYRSQNHEQHDQQRRIISFQFLGGISRHLAIIARQYNSHSLRQGSRYRH